MIKIVIHMNTVKFCNVYWNTIDKYYHVMVWTIIKLQEWCAKCRKNKPNQKRSDNQDGGMKHFNLLKPLSRFYHMINVGGIIIIWLMVNTIIAVLVQRDNADEDVSASAFVIGIIIASILGHIFIMLITKLLHILYMKNIESSFAQKEEDVKFGFKKLPFEDTQKTEKQPILGNLYNVTSDNFETDKFNIMTKEKWEVGTPSSSKNRPDTARTFLSNNSRAAKSGSSTKKVDSVEEEKGKNIKIEYVGDTDLIHDESKKSNNTGNILIFILLLGFGAFLTLFSCIYTYHHYTQSVILSCLLMIIISLVVEVLILRPLTCLLITLYII